MATGTSAADGSQSSGPANDKQATAVKELDENLRLGSWNCRSIQTTSSYERIQVLNYCRDSGCDIIALQETCHNDKQDHVFEDYEVMFVERKKEIVNGKNRLVEGDRGLAFMVKRNKFQSVENPKRLSSRIGLLRFKMNDVNVSLFNIYAPVCKSMKKIEEADDTEEDEGESANREIAKKFYDELSKFYKKEKEDPKRILIICGDLNAFPKNASLGLCEPWVMSNVYGSWNDHGDILLNFLQSNGIYHLNSRFEKRKESKWTWKNSIFTELDGFLSNRMDLVTDIDTFPKKFKINDHRMIVSNWKISKKREDKILKLKKYENVDNSDLISTILKPTVEMEPDVGEIKILKMKDGTETEDAAEIKEIVQLHFKKRYDDPTFHQEVLKENNLQLNEITREDVKNELDKLGPLSPHAIRELKKLQKKLKVSGRTDLLEHIAKNLKSLANNQKLIFHIPTQAVHSKEIEEFDFKKTSSIFTDIYSNILARKCLSTLQAYIHPDEKRSNDFETYRKDKAVEKKFLLTMLLEKRRESPLYILFVTLDKPSETVKISSVLECLRKAKVSNSIISEFSSLLTTQAQINIGRESPITFKKTRGLHIGDVATSLLLETVMRTFVKENIPLLDYYESKDDCTNFIHYDDRLVISNTDIDCIMKHLTTLKLLSKEHGISFGRIDLLKTAAKGSKSSFMIDNQIFKPEKELANRIHLFFDRLIGVEDTLSVELPRKNRKAWEVVHRTYSSAMDVTAKQNFFNDKVIPVFFSNCETWTPTAKEYVGIKEYLVLFKQHLGIVDYEFDPKQYITYKKCRLYDHLRIGKDRKCFTIISSSGVKIAPARAWINDIRDPVKKYEEGDENQWKEFMKDCREKAFPTG
ncbi:hypothetical protein CAEBREN_00593 [Caenorhabditis brenneri]|uniref:Endonuclease/exonuclease/phosphatase domain-containing protein n=1 Tax=Caenorhabditis brenneri TaxID=135651 RepID=G0MWZ5_CAEBE|nr:hypothetical protein CAEBREN_00593 [Caenorhabditis brenneri]